MFIRLIIDGATDTLTGIAEATTEELSTLKTEIQNAETQGESFYCEMKLTKVAQKIN
jgi:hypothetical protein